MAGAAVRRTLLARLGSRLQARRPSRAMASADEVPVSRGEGMGARLAVRGPPAARSGVDGERVLRDGVATFEKSRVSSAGAARRPPPPPTPSSCQRRAVVRSLDAEDTLSISLSLAGRMRYMQR